MTHTTDQRGAQKDQKFADYWQQFVKAKKAHLALAAEPEFRERMNAIAHQAIMDCIAIAEEKFPQWTLGKKIPGPKTIRLDWGARRQTSRGGRGISLAMVRATLPFDVIEYRHYILDPEIGYLVTNCSREHLLVTVAHEMAHVVLWHFIKINGWKCIPPHGKRFQEIYRALRTKLLAAQVAK